MASKKVKDNDVSFSHRSVFPVLFDADAIDKWWKSALVFKVYSRYGLQKEGMKKIQMLKCLSNSTSYVNDGKPQTYFTALSFIVAVYYAVKLISCTQ